jgi:hypothetical protein
MSEAKMRVDAGAGFAAPPFHPIVTDARGGPTFTMLGADIAFDRHRRRFWRTLYSDRAGYAAWLGVPLQLVELARPFGLTLLPPGA